jgi:hypothetical protein
MVTGQLTCCGGMGDADRQRGEPARVNLVLKIIWSSKLA